MLIAECILLVAVTALLIPAATLFLECAASVFARRSNSCLPSESRPELAVVIPAHNEAAGIAKTLQSIQSQIRIGDRIVVVADNCADDTLMIAEREGASVIERNDSANRGKGFALQAALEALSVSPPSLIVFIDADCLLAPRCLDYLADAVRSGGGVVQACFAMPPPYAANVGDLISSFAVTVKNRARPTGLKVMGLPCLLSGSGIAMPWSIAATLPIHGASIVEDLQLSVDLAIAGHAPQFCPEAMVLSSLPANATAARTQRTRWEHGHLKIVLAETPRLVILALLRRKLFLLTMALEMSVPPISLLLMGWLAVTGSSVGFGLIANVWLPAILALLSGAMVFFAIAFAWLRYGRAVVPIIALARIPGYMFAKLPIYLGFVLRQQRTWVRTEREGTAL